MEDINDCNENGRTKLMEAADKGDLEEVKRLLGLGADPFLKDANWSTSTAKMYASRKSNGEDVFYEIECLLGEVTGVDVVKRPKSEEITDYCDHVDENSRSDWDWGGISVFILYGLGVISLILAPFTGVTVVSAAAFFVIGYVLSKTDL